MDLSLLDSDLLMRARGAISGAAAVAVASAALLSSPRGQLIARPQRSAEDTIRQLIDGGDFARAATILEPLSAAGDGNAQWQLERMRRIRLDHPYGQEQVFEQLRSRVPGFTRAELETIEKDGALDSRVIDGRRRYLYAAASNAIFRSATLAARQTGPERMEPTARAMIEAAAADHGQARRLRVAHGVTVKADAVPAGETVRCWVPFPREFPWQHATQLVTSSPAGARLDRPDAPARSAYLETVAQAGKPTVFRVEYEFTVETRRFGLSDATAPASRPAARAPPEVADLTREQPPHVVFTPALRALRDRVVGTEEDPARAVRAIAAWIASECVYSYAPEYSTLDCIPELLLRERHGDCGQSALLLITLCRMSGIPARWQSGWLLLPGLKTIHDWAEVWIAPHGWVPVDPWAVQFALAARSPVAPDARPAVAAFYVGGLDSWRIAANADHGRQLSPRKLHPRSDDVDFQRGEVEWQGGNVYFPDWSYELKYWEIR